MANPIVRDFLTEQVSFTDKCKQRRAFVAKLLSEIRAQCKDSQSLFDDVGWAIMLEIYDMSLLGTGAKIQDLGLRFRHSRETVIRFVVALEAQGLITIYEGSYGRLCAALTQQSMRRLNRVVDAQCVTTPLSRD